VLLEMRRLVVALWATDVGSSEPVPAVDGYVALWFTVGLFVLNWSVRLCVVTPVARALLRQKKKTRGFEAKVVRFAQSTMEAMVYGGFTALGASIVPRQPWIWPSKLWWQGFSTGAHLTMRDDLRCYYLLYGARYAQGFVSVFLEKRRKDFFEMQIHHAVTVAVVSLSYVYGWNRVGAMVMLLLDPADVPLHLAKLCKHLGEAHQRSNPSRAKVFFASADSVFVLFALVFFVTRVAMYPYICWSAHVESGEYFARGLPEWTCILLLETLLALQAYWFFLILKSATAMILHGHVEDVRSDDEHHDE